MDSHATTVVNCMLLALKTYPFKIYINDSNGVSAFNPIAELNLTSGPTILTAEYSVYGNAPTSASARDFITDCFKPSPVRRPYEIPWEQKAMWTFLFGSMLLIAIIGNCIVIWIVLAHREMRTITNYFLLNLSVADLMMSSLNCMFNFIYMLNSDWPFGRFYCSLNNFMGNVTVATSVFTLVAISFDRYVAIVRPLHRRNSRKKARMFVIIIWVLSSMLSLPCLFYSTTEAKVYQSGKKRVVCYVLWPDGTKYPTSLTDYVYNIIFLTFTYGIPMLIMICCYTIMGRVLWGSQSIGEHTQRQIESIKSKKKVVRMFIAVVTIFAVCWLPYHLFYVYSYHQPHITSSNYVPHLFLSFYWLAMSNSMVNPIIYYWMNRRFRHYFQKIMCFCCFHLWQQNELLKSETVYMPNSMSIERRSKSFRQRCNNSIRLSEINNHSTKTLQQVLYVRDNKLKTESMFVECFDSPVGASSDLNFA